MGDEEPVPVEALCDRLRVLAAGSGTVELFVPHHLTFGGQPIHLLEPMGLAMAMIGDTALSLGLFPAGFAEADGGRVYRFAPP